MVKEAEKKHLLPSADSTNGSFQPWAWFVTITQTRLKKCICVFLVLTSIYLLYLGYYVNNFRFAHLMKSSPPQPDFKCAFPSNSHGIPRVANEHSTSARLRLDPKVLLFVESSQSSLGRSIAEVLVANRIKYKQEVTSKSLPILTNFDKGKYGAIVFENFERYLAMDKWNRDILDKYCKEYNVGVIGFLGSREESLVGAKMKGFPLYIHTNLRLRDAYLNPASPVLRLTRAGDTVWGNLPGQDWTTFSPNHSTYVPVELCRLHTDYFSTDNNSSRSKIISIIQDIGMYDGIQRILFGSSLQFWLHRLLFLDSLSYLSHGRLSISLDRYILVDIDDIFVGKAGYRMISEDVIALIQAQERIRRTVPGFRFNLGYSGKYFQRGTTSEDVGENLLLEHANKFWWFCHSWGHQQPHQFSNLTYLEENLRLNMKFAEEHNIPLDKKYSIAPHHSGVYPVHEPLYEAWRNVLKVQVTATEEYPHLRPARLRRGFIHHNIKVLPRQTCGLYTHTVFLDEYPGGRTKLDESIHGGELFQTIVYNPISIFMTHLSNYGNDRLGLYTFESVIKFLRCWTNLNLTTLPPASLGEKYFKMYPDEADPIWGNPCDDRRHLEIWSRNKTCTQLPRFLVIGPQKTGTTALYMFLTMHPTISSNYPSPETFEEIQFFNGKNYKKGLDWYMDFFPISKNSTSKYLFEKSATYFDGENIPKRVHALLPKVQLVTLLISPAKRAYSWYQHQRAHGDPFALNYTFYEILKLGEKGERSPKGLKDLRNRCLIPGMYSHHLERWLSYFPPQKLYIMDGEILKNNPVESMKNLQRFLKIKPFFDYTNHLKYNPSKGFHCMLLNPNSSKDHCLGKGKGRTYPPMDVQSYRYLQQYYMPHNTALERLLKRLGYQIPSWLKEDLSDNIPAKLIQSDYNRAGH